MNSRAKPTHFYKHEIREIGDARGPARRSPPTGCLLNGRATHPDESPRLWEMKDVVDMLEAWEASQ